MTRAYAYRGAHRHTPGAPQCHDCHRDAATWDAQGHPLCMECALDHACMECGHPECRDCACDCQCGLRLCAACAERHRLRGHAQTPAAHGRQTPVTVEDPYNPF